jgi:lactoylglutathione lyase
MSAGGKQMKLDHVTINVRSMEKSIAFYENVIGLPKGQQVDMGNHVIQYFDLGNCLLELIQYRYDTDGCDCPVDNIGKLRHIALETDDVQGMFERIRDSGMAVILAEPAHCDNLSFTNFLIRDPNGVELEILKRD